MASVAEVLTKRIQEEIDSASAALIAGGVKDFSQYKDATGFIRGLEFSKREINDLLRKLDEDDD